MQSKSYHHDKLSPAQQTILEMIEPGSQVLEVGCATGYMTKALKENCGCRVTAVEIDAGQAAHARPHAEELIVADIACPETWERIRGEFDVVVFADVLEHLADPWEALRRTRGVLRRGGRVLASIPNIAYYKVRKDLLLGRFDYTDYGILDDTHLRFFTARTVNAMFLGAGYRISRFHRMYRGRIDRALGHFYPNAFTYQFVIAAEF